MAMPSSSPPPPPQRSKKAPSTATTFHDVAVFNSLPPLGRDWAELPLDVLSCVFHRLDAVELLTGGAAAVCRSWRRAARHEPELWRRIDMRSTLVPRYSGRLERAALRFSKGQCEAFWCKDGVDDHLILFLADQAPSLKTLHLVTYFYHYSEAFVEAIKRFPLLEELELSLIQSIRDNGVLELVSKTCPRLKHFKHMSDIERPPLFCDTNNRISISRMQELRSLELFGDNLDNEGLTTILDNCSRLEYLNLHACRSIDMDDDLKGKCDRIKTKTLFPCDYSFLGYLDPVNSSWSCCFLTCTKLLHDGDRDDDGNLDTED